MGQDCCSGSNCRDGSSGSKSNSSGVMAPLQQPMAWLLALVTKGQPIRMKYLSSDTLDYDSGLGRSAFAVAGPVHGGDRCRGRTCVGGSRGSAWF
mmetsp:Transcript_16386/g.48843  ORF Transcript_16386/g.48843 Transcript_16386/m.48843 type:complete len:95 (-) Transcript_16386:177-461(-)